MIYCADDVMDMCVFVSIVLMRSPVFFFSLICVCICICLSLHALLLYLYISVVVKQHVVSRTPYRQATVAATKVLLGRLNTVLVEQVLI